MTYYIETIDMIGFCFIILLFHAFVLTRNDDIIIIVWGQKNKNKNKIIIISYSDGPFGVMLWARLSLTIGRPPRPEDL